jgi:NUMOD3 motif
MVPSINTFCVYFHYRKSDHKLFYIGYGTPTRPYDFYHRSPYWKRVAKKHGVDVVIFKNHLSKEMACQLETDQINMHKPQCNFAPGGCGGNIWSTLSNEKQEDIRNKIRTSQSGSNHSQYGKPKSLESKLKMRAAKLANPPTHSRIPIICLNTGKEYVSSIEACRELNLHPSKVSLVLNGYRNHTRGFRFAFKK